jgi:hypothetical protein
MRLNRKLNIVVPVSTDAGTIFVHSTPISRDTFEQFYLELGKVFSQCFDSNNAAHLALTAPQLAYPALKSIAKAEGKTQDVQFGLINEIVRLSNAMVPGENGLESMPLDIAIKREILDEDAANEILSALVFFTSISRVAPKDLRDSFLEMAGSLRSWELTSLDSTMYIASLQTLRESASTGGKKKQSSVVS